TAHRAGARSTSCSPAPARPACRGCASRSGCRPAGSATAPAAATGRRRGRRGRGRATRLASWWVSATYGWRACCCRPRSPMKRSKSQEAATGPLVVPRRRSHNRGMEIRSDNAEHGFQFPDEFQLSAMGPAARDRETALPSLLLDAGIEVVTEQVDWKHSSNGRYVSVRIVFRAESREQYDRAHEVLRGHPEVKWTL